MNEPRPRFDPYASAHRARAGVKVPAPGKPPSTAPTVAQLKGRALEARFGALEAKFALIEAELKAVRAAVASRKKTYA